MVEADAVAAMMTATARWAATVAARLLSPRRRRHRFRQCAAALSPSRGRRRPSSVVRIRCRCRHLPSPFTRAPRPHVHNRRAVRANLIRSGGKASLEEEVSYLALPQASKSHRRNVLGGMFWGRKKSKKYLPQGLISLPRKDPFTSPLGIPQ